GRKVTMVPGFIGVGLTMGLLGLTAFFHLSLPWFLAAFFITVMAQGLTGGSIQTVGADVAPPEARGLFLGMWRFTAQIGTVASPSIFAVLADHVGYGSSFTFVGACGLTVALILITRVPETGRTRAARTAQA